MFIITILSIVIDNVSTKKRGILKYHVFCRGSDHETVCYNRFQFLNSKSK